MVAPVFENQSHLTALYTRETDYSSTCINNENDELISDYEIIQNFERIIGLVERTPNDLDDEYENLNFCENDVVDENTNLPEDGNGYNPAD